MVDERSIGRAAVPFGSVPNGAGHHLSALWFCRGRGRGHANGSRAIVRALERVAPHVHVQLVSYSTGAAALRQDGERVVDLDLPEQNGFIATLIQATELIRELKPDLVIAHEEFAALVAARTARIPGVFVSAWFPQPGTIAAEGVACCAASVILEEPGLFEPPARLAAAPRYAGPLVRPMNCSREDRDRLRAAQGIPGDAWVISVIPGGWATEERTPIFELVAGAFRLLPSTAKRLFWVSAADHDLLAGRQSAWPGLRVEKFWPVIEELMVMSDVVLTKGTYSTAMEAASLGIPTLSLSHGLNPIDEVLVPRIRSNRSLLARALNAADLTYHLNRIRDTPGLARPAPLALHQRGAQPAAAVLAEEIARIAPLSVRREGR